MRTRNPFRCRRWYPGCTTPEDKQLELEILDVISDDYIAHEKAMKRVRELRAMLDKVKAAKVGAPPTN